MGRKPKKQLIIDRSALEAARLGTMEDLLWFGWYTLNDNLDEGKKLNNTRAAKCLINTIRDYKGLKDRPLEDWNQSHCILVLDWLRTKRRLSW